MHRRGQATTFRSLRNRNYRLFFFGQLASLAGTFMQTTAQAWLVLERTGSGTALGVVAALQYLPMLLSGGYGGVLVDRFDRRRLFLMTQVAGATEAALLAVLVLSGALQTWMIFGLAFVLGLITTIEQPLKHALVFDLVGPDDLENAVSLNISLQSAGRVVGPALAGVVIAAFDVGVCFAVNAVSFGFVIAALLAMNLAPRTPAIVRGESRGMFRDGLRQIGRDRRLTTLLVTSGVLFGLAWEFEVVVPLLARSTFGGGATTLGLLLSSQAVGAVAGGLFVARRAGTSRRRSLPRRAMAFAAALLGAAIAPTLWLEIVALTVCGFVGVSLVAVVSSRVQLLAPSEIRGRVMAIFTLTTVGVRPLGGPIVGAVGQGFGPRYSLGVGVVAVLAVVPVWLVVGRRIRRSESDQDTVVPDLGALVPEL